MLFLFLFFHLFSSRKEERTANLHAIPDFGAGKGVPFQPLPDTTEADRDRSRPLSHGATDQNLVPKPSHEVEEGKQGQTGRWMLRRPFGRTRPRYAAVKSKRLCLGLATSDLPPTQYTSHTPYERVPKHFLFFYYIFPLTKYYRRFSSGRKSARNS